MAVFRPKDLLITGGAGFIGSECVRAAVRKGHRPLVVDTLTYAGDLARLKDVAGKIRFQRMDIGSAALGTLVGRFKPDAVIHFAAETHVDRSILYPEQFVAANVQGTLNVLSAAHKAGVGQHSNVQSLDYMTCDRK